MNRDFCWQLAKVFTSASVLSIAEVAMDSGTFDDARAVQTLLALSRCSRFLNDDPKQLTENASVEKLLQKVSDHLKLTTDGRWCSAIARTLEELCTFKKLRMGEMYAVLDEAAFRTSVDMNAGEVANTVYALSRMEYQISKRTHVALQKATIRVSECMDARRVAKTVWGFGKMTHPVESEDAVEKSQFFEIRKVTHIALQNATLRVAKRYMDTEALSRILWGFSQMDFRCSRTMSDTRLVLQTAVHRVVTRMGFTKQQIDNFTRDVGHSI